MLRWIELRSILVSTKTEISVEATSISRRHKYLGNVRIKRHKYTEAPKSKLSLLFCSLFQSDSIPAQISDEQEGLGAS